MQQTRFAPDDSWINERELEHADGETENAPAGDGEMEHAFTKNEQLSCEGNSSRSESTMPAKPAAARAQRMPDF